MKTKQFLILFFSVAIFTACNSKQKPAENMPSASSDVSVGEAVAVELNKISFNYPSDWTFTKDQNEGKSRYESHSFYKTSNPYHSVMLYFMNQSKNLKPENLSANNLVRTEFTLIDSVKKYGDYAGKGILVETLESGKKTNTLYFSAIQGDTVIFQIVEKYPAGERIADFDVIEKSMKVK